MKVVNTVSLPSFTAHGLELRPFPGHQLMLLRVDGGAGAQAPRHSHPHEQISLVVSGRVRFWLEGVERVLVAGDALHIPSGAEHGAEFLESSLIYDLYHPVRQDMLARLTG
jgi:unsaturated pyranuronate lyase